MTNPLSWKYQYIPVKLGRKAVSFTFHHVLESHLWFYYLKKLKISPTIYDKWEKCDCVQHVGTDTTANMWYNTPGTENLQKFR